MIYRARTITLHPEQNSEKRAAYKAAVLSAAAYVNQHYPAIHVEILENIAGPQQQIHMITRCESLAALEAYETQRKTDAGWLALAEKAGALHATLETVDHLYRVLS